MSESNNGRSVNQNLIVRRQMLIAPFQERPYHTRNRARKVPSCCITLKTVDDLECYGWIHIKVNSYGHLGNDSGANDESALSQEIARDMNRTSETTCRTWASSPLRIP